MLCYTGHMRLHCRTKWQGVAGFSQIRTPFIPPRAYLCYKCDSRCNQQHRRRHQLCCFFSYFFPSWALPLCFTLSLYTWLSLSLSPLLLLCLHFPPGAVPQPNRFPNDEKWICTVRRFDDVTEIVVRSSKRSSKTLTPVWTQRNWENVKWGD